MTAFPDPLTSNTIAAAGAAKSLTLRPQVSERFWGYEVCTTQAEIASAAMIRAIGIFSAFVFGTAAAGLLVLPAGLTPGIEPTSKGLAALILIAMAALAGIVASQCRKIRIQVDTQQGEIRQVARGSFGPTTVLSRHGLDTVTDVRVVASKFDPSFGQVQVDIAGHSTIVVADGALTALGPLRRRLLNDCGLQTDDVRHAVWSGPLAAA